MSMKRFYQNIRLARSLLGRAKVAVDGPRAGDPRRMEESLDRSDMWLTPRIVAEFDPTDFEFLDRASQERLKGAVDSFLAIAREVPSDQRATADQSRDGRRHLEDVVQILQIGDFPDVEHFKAEKVLQRLSSPRYLPSEVERLAFEFDISSMDEPMVWIWGIIRDECLEAARERPISSELRALISDHFNAFDVKIDPYVSIRSRSEQEAIERRALSHTDHAS